MKKFDNFCRALTNLEKTSNYQKPYDTIVLTGMTALYEICFEQAWKAMKEILEQQGFSENKTGSPRQVLKTAYQAGMINNEEVWLQALQARNNVAHAYNEAIAKNIVRESQEIYISMFRDLKTTLETNWL
jgi:nucleotidyltransferase substrate-binding family protein